jgi:signal transduction histidine kinase
MSQYFRRIKSFLGPYDYRPGLIYWTTLLFSIANLRTHSFDYEFGMDRINFLVIGIFTYAIISLPLYLLLKLSLFIWRSKQKSFRAYLLEALIASMTTLLVQISAQKALVPLYNNVEFLQTGQFFGNLVTRIIISILLVAVTHNRWRSLSQELEKASALNNELNERYAILVESDEEIRSHASALLHDRIQAKLMLAGAKLTRVSEVISNEGKLAVLPIIKEIEEIRSIDLREVSQLLVPNLASEGLVGSCENLINEFSTDLTFTLEISQVVESFDEEIKLGIYRIIEQGVINSIKHGPASHITIRVAENSDNEICVEVVDNGRGGSVNSSGKGTVTIDAWLSILDGRKEIESRLGNGFTLRVILPKR